MPILTWFLTSKVGRFLSAAFTAALVLYSAFALGKRDQNQKQKQKKLEDYIETRERIDHVETSPTRDAAIERLRDNKWVR